MKFEAAGIPSVPLVASEFQEDARATASGHGMNRLPIVVLPRVLSNAPDEEIRAMVDEAMPSVIEALTSAAAVRPQLSPIDRDSGMPYLSYSDPDPLTAMSAFQQDFIVRGWGDGMPLVPPTEEAVEEMLAGCPEAADDIIAVLPPGMGMATVRSLAVCAVMAGCKPEHLPVINAAVRAMASPEFALNVVAASTGPHAPLIVVNGPIVDEIGLNCKAGALGPGSPSYVNTVIGRAIRLVLMHVAKAYLGIIDMDTIGSPRKYSMCIGENSPQSPWSSFAEERGFGPDDDIVTVFGVESDVEVFDFTSVRAVDLVRTFAGTAVSTGAASVQMAARSFFDMHNMLLICPDHARVFDREGWTKDDIREAMFHYAQREWRWVGSMGIGELKPAWRWLNSSPEAVVPVVPDKSFFEIVVVGGAAGKSQYHLGVNVPVSQQIFR